MAQTKTALRLSILFVCLMLATTLVSARTVKLATLNWEPYAGENLPRFGFTSNIISEAFKRLGHSVEFTFLPWQRALHSAEIGRFDGVFSAYYSDTREGRYLISDAYAESSVVLTSMSGRSIKYQNLSDLRPYSIGVVRGYVNSDEFDKATYLNKHPVISDALNIKKLVNNRVDLIVIDRYVAIHQMKTNPTIHADVRDIEFLSPVLKRQTLHVLFSKNIEEAEQLVADFNKGLRMIKDDGSYYQILDRFGITPEL